MKHRLLALLSREAFLTGSVLIMAGLVFNKMLAMAYNILLARTLHSRDFGVLVLGLSIFELVNVPSGLGMAGLLPKYISEFRTGKEYKKINDVISLVMSSCISIGIIMTLAIGAVSGILALHVFRLPELARVLIILSVSVPFTIGNSVLVSLFRGYQQIRPKILLQDLLLPLFKIAMFTALFSFGYGLQAACYAFTLANIIIFTVTLMTAYRSLDIQLRVNFYDQSITPGLFRMAWPLSLQTLVVIIYAQVDRLFLGYFLPPGEIGIYGAAYSITSMMSIIPMAFYYLSLPLFAKILQGDDPAQIKAVYNRIALTVFRIALPVLGTLMLFAKQFLGILYGREYTGGATVLWILSLGIFSEALLGPAIDSLVASGKTRMPLYSALVGCLLNIILNILLIPRLGITGAALAACSSMVLSKIILGVANYRQHKILPLNSRHLVYAAISLCIAILIVYLDQGMPALNGTFRTLALSCGYIVVSYALFYALDHWSGNAHPQQETGI
jgi:O-antigen/teichoic acid export membrane protein